MKFSKEQQLNWLAQVEEEIIDSEREIIDPHHHLWTSDRKIGETEIPQYILGDLWKDTGSGHNIVKTIFMECRSEYFTEGPEHLRVIGETEFVATSAKKSLNQGKAEIAGIISHTDLTQNEAILREVLGAHETAGQGLFRGIRHGGAHDPYKTMRWVDATPHKDLFALPSFRSGVRLLGELGYTYDSWHFHFQNESFANMARAVPETTIILDHFGIPCGVGDYEGRQSEVWERWKKGIIAMAQLENVFVKIGGLAMPVNGFNWHLQESPTLGGHAIREAVKRAGIEPEEVDDVIMGCAVQQGSSGYNIGRTAGVVAGLPVTVSGMSIDRQCSSGMMAIATAAKQIIHDGMPIVVGAGLESISLVQNEHQNQYRATDPNVLKIAGAAYMPMIDTAEVVAKRYNISREAQDEYALQSQQRTAAGQENGKFDDEIVPMPSTKVIFNQETENTVQEDVLLRGFNS